jgi:hypothetical protein
VLARVESKTYASNPAVVVEYLKALVATERLNEYADSSSSSSSSSKGAAMLVGGGATPAPGQDHRSLLALLKELQGLAGGGAGVSEAPGSSLRRPLHVVLQVRCCFKVVVCMPFSETAFEGSFESGQGRSRNE